jgi:hypothetical protein
MLLRIDRTLPRAPIGETIARLICFPILVSLRLLPAILLTSCLAFAAATPRSLPLAFEENTGQADSNTIFLARASGYAVHLGQGRVTPLRGRKRHRNGYSRHTDEWVCPAIRAADGKGEVPGWRQGAVDHGHSTLRSSAVSGSLPRDKSGALRLGGRARVRFLPRSGRLLLKNPWNLSDDQKERLSTLVQWNMPIEGAYYLKEAFQLFCFTSSPRGPATI